MKIRLLFTALLCTAASVSGLFAEDHTPLEEQMEKMNGAYRKLRAGVADATKNEQSLAAVVVLRETAEASLKLEPAKKADVPAADQEKFVADYRAKMKTLIEESVKLEAALKAGKNEEAAKIFAGLREMQSSAHKEFRRPPAKKG